MKAAMKAPTSPLPWRAVQAGPGWMLQADDGSWVANFHSQADAEYVVKAVEVCRHLGEPGTEPQPASPLPWRDQCYRSWIVDADGQWVAEFSEAEDLAYALHAANAYPRLKAALDKALEACRWITAHMRLDQTMRRWRRLSFRAYTACGMKRAIALEKAWKPAREALEMAESDSAAEAESGDHRSARCTAYHADDPRLKPEPPALKITVGINGVTATSTLHPRAGERTTAEDLEKAVVAVARMAAQMIAREMAAKED